ncbi:alpha/beta fold hydrolase, partial [Paracidovorax oryzae]|uniref:alpha/beta fold hydrolase n=1 Tax=Paracidovorax oryzae TaxID=862720 RepID=UPI001ED929F5
MSALPPALPAAALPEPTAHDAWVDSARGRLFARRWQPAPHDAPRAIAPAPVILFHDSLGCVALWRDFPAALCRATGRDVIAYDRSGFGRADLCTGALPPDFIAAEARTSLPALRSEFGIGRYVALGHSVGGAMAAHCAAEGSGTGDCVALVTVAAQACVEERTLAGIREARDQFQRSPEALQRLPPPPAARWTRCSPSSRRWCRPAHANGASTGPRHARPCCACPGRARTARVASTTSMRPHWRG